MEKSKELLRDTEINVKQIFGMVGYVDVANASKKFKAMFGITPSEYRTLTRGLPDTLMDEDNTDSK